MGNDAAVVDSSTTEKTSTQILKEMTPTQHKHWRATGELPEAKKEEVKTDSVKAVGKDSKTDAGDEKKPAAESSTAKAAPEKKAEEPAKSAPADNEPQARTRIGKDLVAENKRLTEELETLRRQLPAPVKKSDAAAKPGRNDVDEHGKQKYSSDDEYLEARDKWVMEEASRTTREQIAKETRDREIQKQNELMQKRMQNSVKIATEKHADFLQVLQAETKDGKTVFNNPAIKAIKTNGVIDAWCLDSEHGMEILYHFAKEGAEEVERIQSLNPFAAARELTKLEEKLASASATTKKEDSKAQPKPEEKAQHKEPPAPATKIDGKNTPAVDEENAATESGDFKRFQRAANEAEWRKKKGA